MQEPTVAQTVWFQELLGPPQCWSPPGLHLAMFEEHMVPEIEIGSVEFCIISHSYL